MSEDGGYLRHIGVSDSLSILAGEVLSGRLPAQGMLRLTLRKPQGEQPSVLKLEARILDAFVFLCTVFGPAARIFDTLVRVPARPEEIQHLAVIRIGSGTIVHLDASSRSDHAGGDAWEFASRDSLLAMDERRDDPLLQGALGLGESPSRVAKYNLGALGLGDGSPAEPAALAAAVKLLAAMAQSAATGEPQCP